MTASQISRAAVLAGIPAGVLGIATGPCAEPDRVAELAAALHTGVIPCLMVFGESDDEWPVSVQRNIAGRLGATVAMIPDARRSPNTENPKALLDTLLPTWQLWLSTTLTS